MKKVLIITYYWPPCGGPGVQRMLKFARYLPEFGYMPTVVTVDENKASYPVIDQSLLNDVPETIKVYRTDTSEPFGLYSKITKKKEIPHSGFANEDNPSLIQKASRFVRGNLFLPDARKGWNKFALKQVREIISAEKFDAVITSSPPHSTQLLGLKLKKEFGLRWIADLRDPWTDIYYYKDMMHLPVAKKIDAAYEKTVLENADEILVVSDAIKKIFLSKSAKLSPGKFHVIPNGYDDADFSVASNITSDNFLITYTGTLATNYGVENFIRVCAEIINEDKESPLRMRFVGELADTIKELIQQEGLSGKVEYMNYVPHKKAVSLLLDSTALLLAIPRIENNEGILTGKLFEYLASRKPIICIGPEKGDAAKIIDDCVAGSTFDYEEKIKLKLYLQRLISEWKQNNDIDRKGEFHLIYSRKKQAEELSRIIGISEI